MDTVSKGLLAIAMALVFVASSLAQEPPRYYWTPPALGLHDAYVYDDFDKQKRYVVLTVKNYTATHVEGGMDVDNPLLQVEIDQDKVRLLAVNPQLSGKAAYSYTAKTTVLDRGFLFAVMKFQKLLQTTPPFPRN